MTAALRQPRAGPIDLSEIDGLLAVMLRYIDQRRSIVVYLTSAFHGEGTTTIARELASKAAQLGWCKVALIDAGSAQSAGSSGVRPRLLDNVEEGDDLPLHHTCWRGGDMMQGVLIGEGDPLPPAGAVRAVFDRLRKCFTLVVVDGPPVLAASHGAAALSAAADCVVIVVEAERAGAVDLERARGVLEQLGANIVGIVLNKRPRWIPAILSRLIWGSER